MQIHTAVRLPGVRVSFKPGDERALAEQATRAQLQYLTTRGVITGFVTDTETPIPIRALSKALATIFDLAEVQRMKAADTRVSSHEWYDRRIVELEILAGEKKRRMAAAEAQHIASVEQRTVEGGTVIGKGVAP